jgi:hypothetical protein
MKPWISAAAGVLPGYAVLALAVLWLRSMCLPVSAHEFKWQCAISFWAVAAAYFGCCFVAAFLAGRWRVAVGLIAFAILFVGHALVPDLAIISFGKRWYFNGYTLSFAVIPALMGVAAAILVRRHVTPMRGA